MPYITQEDRDFLYFPKNAGELNFLLTTICDEYIQTNGARYQSMNDVIGALEGCKLEFYRRIVSPYEDIKLSENGDVYNV